MTYRAHSDLDPQDHRPRAVDSLLAPTLNRGGYDADNFELDTRIMLAGLSPPSTAIASFLQGCLTSSFEPDSFSPAGRAVVLTSAAFARWETIRAAFITSRGSPAPLANIVTR